MIAGMCRIWARRNDQPYWQVMPYAARGYSESLQLVDIYEEQWGQMYDYVVTADHDCCRPPSVSVSKTV